MEKLFEEALLEISKDKYGKAMKELSTDEIYGVLGEYINGKCLAHEKSDEGRKTAAYLSAEFLIGRLLQSNLFNLGITELADKSLADQGKSLSDLENIEDYAFGNGGLGRLAACFLDSAASTEIPLDGYSIRYKYGLFHQSFDKEGEQIHHKDDWHKSTDPFGRKIEAEKVRVGFADYSVYAIPYDYFIIGYSFKSVRRLRLYEAEAIECDESKAAELYEYLYPDDSTYEGKKLRLRQQYFFTSAAMQNIINKLGLENIEDKIKIQLNDTHPVIAIPEFIRLATGKGLSFDEAFRKATKLFAYTNHTVMPEALEQWERELMRSILPEILTIIEKINSRLMKKIEKKNEDFKRKCAILENERVYMANLACYVCSDINGVAKLHSDIIKTSTLSQWYELYPEKFSNKTNGITQRRWLGLCNTELYNLICGLCGGDVCTDIGVIDRLSHFTDDVEVLEKLKEIRQRNKESLCDYILKKQGVKINPDSVFFAHIKRIHEYKRQLLAALLICWLYKGIKSGKVKDIPPMTFIFAGKAAQSYEAAKRIIKFINKLSYKINEDSEIGDKLKVVFLENYNVSLAERIIPAADISMQVSLAGTEASGTGNMKLMMNGALTLGTYDGANIEIVELASRGNNYIFGLDENAVKAMKMGYDPKKLYDTNKDIRLAVDSLIDGTVGEKGEFNDIFDSLFKGNTPDRYMVLADLMSLCEATLTAAKDYEDTHCFFKKALLNISSSAFFSSDRTVGEYADEIWFKS